tara:strand:+ start:218 stop:1324 length:1107 start_codon:yes stop_codon:yes gene_type:complete
MKRIYLDHNATTPLHPKVEKKLKESLSYFANPSALYQSARHIKYELEEARESIASIIGAKADQIIFNSGATEGNNHILSQLKPKEHLIISSIEHSSTIQAAHYLSKNGIEVSYCPVLKSGVIDLNRLKKLIKPNTKLISIIYANNETGCIQPIKDVIELAKEHHCKIHSDAVQALGKLKLDLNQTDLDYCTLSAHKIGGPKGIGALFIKNPNSFKSMIKGPYQEKGLRPGTENILGIIGFKTAIEHCNPLAYQSHCQPLKQFLIDKLANLNPIIFGNQAHCLAGTLYMGFQNTDGHNTAIQLDLQGIEVSTGSACSVGAIEPSTILKAMQIPDSINRSAIRVSMNQNNTKEEIKQLITSLSSIISKSS